MKDKEKGFAKESLILEAQGLLTYKIILLLSIFVLAGWKILMSTSFFHGFLLLLFLDGKGFQLLATRPSLPQDHGCQLGPWSSVSINYYP